MQHDKYPAFWPLVYLSTAAFAALIIWIIIKLPMAEHNSKDSFIQDYALAEKSGKTGETEEADNKVIGSEANLPAETNTPPKTPVTSQAQTPAKTTIDNIVKTARTWMPAYSSWYGKMAPDFTLPDINGKQHKLSDYRRKDVLIVFWAAWCRPCLKEIPNLIELRNTVSEDKLAILAVSNESPAMLKRFAADYKINYAVLCSGTRVLPAPFNNIFSIPCSFFITPDGKIKFATEGFLQLETTQALLHAE